MKTSGRPFQKGSVVHTARFFVRDFRNKFALTGPLIPPTQVAMMEFELQLEELLMECELQLELLAEELQLEELQLEPNLMMMKKLKMTALTMYYKLQ